MILNDLARSHMMVCEQMALCELQIHLHQEVQLSQYLLMNKLLNESHVLLGLGQILLQ